MCFCLEGRSNEEQQKSIFSHRPMASRLELKVDFVNLDDGLYRQFYDE